MIVIVIVIVDVVAHVIVAVHLIGNEIVGVTEAVNDAWAMLTEHIDP